MDEIEFPVCEVAAGQYAVGSRVLRDSRPEHPVELAAFSIGQTAVTNQQLRPFVDAGGYSTERYWTEIGWRWLRDRPARAPAFWEDAAFNAPDQPVVGVSWYEAIAFTHWLAETTGTPWRLPTEVEWEAAARGPFDEAPKPRLFNTAERGIGHPWAVTEWGNRSWCGAQDLCGNIWEWCSTRWGHSYYALDYAYPYVSDDGREFLDGSHARVIRGGSWFNSLPEADPAHRSRYLPGSKASNIGFRLALSR